jgi:hypothetical protein
MEIPSILENLKNILENISLEKDPSDSKQELESIKNKLIKVQSFLIKNSKVKNVENNLSTIGSEITLANQIQSLVLIRNLLG